MYDIEEDIGNQASFTDKNIGNVFYCQADEITWWDYCPSIKV